MNVKNSKIHGPLRRRKSLQHETLNKYRHNRYKDPEYTDQGDPLFDVLDLLDWFWNPEYPYDSGNYDNDVRFHNFTKWIESIAFMQRLPLNHLVKPSNLHNKIISDVDSVHQNKIQNIENSLVSFDYELDNFDDEIDDIVKFMSESKSQFDDVNFDSRGVEIVRAAAEKNGNSDFASNIFLYSPFWIRSPLTWNENSCKSLLDHLFVIHKVPEFLHNEWFRNFNTHSNKWLNWFVILGQGGSLKLAAELFDWNIAGKFSHYLTDIPEDFSPLQACIVAEVKRLGGSDTDALRILGSPEFVIDPTEISSDKSYCEFWTGTVLWIIKNSNEIADDQSTSILSWAMHKYTELRRNNEQFSWKGRSVQRVIESSEEYYIQIEFPWLNYKWQSHNWNYEINPSEQEKWSFVELISGQELFTEGKKLNHCVASYAGRCASGYSAIVSLRQNNLHKITIEINPETLQIIQARGDFNREVNKQEKQVISMWFNNIVHQIKIS